MKGIFSTYLNGVAFCELAIMGNKQTAKDTAVFNLKWQM